MIVPLKDYITPFTPFLARVQCTGEFASFKGIGKVGLGPVFIEGDEESTKWAKEAENTLISSYIDSWIRGQIYLHACEHGFKPVGGCGCDLIPQHEQRYPLRCNSSGFTIDPMVIVDNKVLVNPLWETAPEEFFFAFNQDSLRLYGHVSRALQDSQYKFKIDLALKIPQGTVCVQRKPRS